MTSRVGTDLDDEIFERLNRLIADEDAPKVPTVLSRREAWTRAKRAYRQWQRENPGKRARRKPALCGAPECGRPCSCVGLCTMHAKRFRRGRQPELAPIVAQFRVRNGGPRKVA